MQTRHQKKHEYKLVSNRIAEELKSATAELTAELIENSSTATELKLVKEKLLKLQELLLQEEILKSQLLIASQQSQILREQLFSKAEAVWFPGSSLVEVLRICDFPLIEMFPLGAYVRSQSQCNRKSSHFIQRGKLQTQQGKILNHVAATLPSSLSNEVNTLRLSKIDLTASRLELVQFNMTEEFCDHLFVQCGLDISAVNRVVEDNIMVLNSLRNAFVWYNENFSRTIDDVHGFQPTMKKFIDGFILGFKNADILVNISIMDANRDCTLQLVGSVYLKDPSNISVEHDIYGTTDLVITAGGIEDGFDSYCSNIISIIEVKSCFSKSKGLYHSASDKPRDQMLLETECLFQMRFAPSDVELTPSSTPVSAPISGPVSTTGTSACSPAVTPAPSFKLDSVLCKCFLTDLFVICVDFRVETIGDTGVHLLSQRVTDAKLYLKILLLSCLILTGRNIQQAIVEGVITFEVTVNSVDDEVDDEVNDEVNDEEKLASVVNGKHSSGHKGKGRALCWNAFDREAEMLDRMDDVRRQDRRKSGLRALTASELSRL